MRSELMEFTIQQLSVGSAMQNFAFYSFVALMLLVVFIQINAHNETGIRKFVLRNLGKLGDAITNTTHAAYFVMKRLFLSRH